MAASLAAALAGLAGPVGAQPAPAGPPAATPPAATPPAAEPPAATPLPAAEPPAAEPPVAGPPATVAPLGEPATPSAQPRGSEPSDQSIAAAAGVASGGRVTPGGVRVTGHYLYQLSASDWFDGTAAFTFGGGTPACFRDRMDVVLCDHGFADGGAVELAAGVRRMFAAQGQFRPFARIALGLSIVRFADDELTGFVIPIHLGGGLRSQVSHAVAIVAQAELAIGLGQFNRGLGSEPQLGLAVTAGAEFRLR